MVCLSAALLAAAAVASTASPAAADVASSPTPAAATLPSLSEVQSTYLERCGGCHGIQGFSAPGAVPTLRGQVGYFLCTAEARDYLIRLPSVATSPLSDRELADLMNFVVFDLGGAPRTYEKFTDGEVHTLRKRPLKDVALSRYRAGLIERLISRCAAPVSLRQYSASQGQ